MPPLMRSPMPSSLFSNARLLIATFWVGTLWTTGFVVAPTLFATLSDRALAGTIAGSLFRVVAWLSLFCAAALCVLLLQARRGAQTNGQDKPANNLFYLIIAMALCVVVGYFSLQPHMAELRLIMHGAAGDIGNAAQLAAAKKQFGILHAVSTAFFMAQSLLGALLVIKLR
jgi:hypothetical protein